MAALVDPYPYVEPERLLASHTLLVALDEIQDPHNLGAIIRTAEAAGAGIVIPRHRAAQVTGAVVKASAGATEHASVAMVRNLADFLQAAKEKGFWVYGAAAEAKAPYTAQDYTLSHLLRHRLRGRGHRPEGRLALRRHGEPAPGRQSVVAQRERVGGDLLVRGGATACSGEPARKKERRPAFAKGS